MGPPGITKKKAFGIKWARGSIEALGVLYTYDQKLLLENNFIENLDKITVECCELCNRSSSRFPVVRSDETRCQSLELK